jgi:phosphoglucomutase
MTRSGAPQDGAAMVLGGDGRWYNKQAAQIIIKLAAGNGVAKMYVGRDGFLCTPAASAVIRARKAAGGFIMSASHNPGGPENDWGIKFNSAGGEPAPEKLTDAIYGFTQSVSVLKFADIPDVDLSKVGVTRFGAFEVEVIDPVADYLALFKARCASAALRCGCERPKGILDERRTRGVRAPRIAPRAHRRRVRNAARR